MQLQLYSSVEDSGENNILMPNMKSLELGHFPDAEEPQVSHNADSTDKAPLDSANVMFSADTQLQDEEPKFVANFNAEKTKEVSLAASIGHLPSDSVNEIFLDDNQASNKEDDYMVTSNGDNPNESSSTDSAEHFHLEFANEMFPDDLESKDKELGCVVVDGSEPIANTVALPSGSDLHEDSLQLEKHTDDDPLDKHFIVEADDNSQKSLSVYSQSEKTSGFNAQLQANYLSHDAVLNRRDLEVKDSSDQVPSEDSEPNIDEDALVCISAENEDFYSKEDMSPSTHSLEDSGTLPGDSSEPNVVSLHQEGEKLQVSDSLFLRPCTNDNNLTQNIRGDNEDEPSKPELCVVDSKDETSELDTSLCGIGIPEKGVAEASVSSRCSYEIPELQPIASFTQAISETCLQEASEPWLDEPTSSFQLPDVDERPPLPPLPPLEWRLGNLQTGLSNSEWGYCSTSVGDQSLRGANDRRRKIPPRSGENCDGHVSTRKASCIFASGGK